MLYIAITCILIGAFCYTLIAYLELQWFEIKKGMPAEGKVLELKQDFHDNNVYYPIIEYKFREEIKSFTSIYGSSNPPDVGEMVEVYISASDDSAEMNASENRWGFRIIYLGLGSIFFMIGLSLLFSES